MAGHLEWAAQEELKEEGLAVSVLMLVVVWVLSPDLRDMAPDLRLRRSSRRPTSSASACLRRRFLLVAAVRPFHCLFGRCYSLSCFLQAAQVQVLQAASPCQELRVLPSALQRVRRSLCLL
jgi:hypothetical protein